jgi:hypothetical protein
MKIKVHIHILSSPLNAFKMTLTRFTAFPPVFSLGLIITKRLLKVFSCQVSVLMPCLGDIGFLQSRILRYFSSDIFFSQIFGSHNLATPYQKQQSYIHNI